MSDLSYIVFSVTHEPATRAYYEYSLEDAKATQRKLGFEEDSEWAIAVVLK